MKIWLFCLYRVNHQVGSEVGCAATVGACGTSQINVNPTLIYQPDGSFCKFEGK